MDDRWDRLVDIVGEAALLEPDAARAYLVSTLHDDPALLAEAESILEGGTEDDGFLQRDGASGVPATALVEGSEVGPFRLLKLLGQGGMGTVFLARQEGPDRVVALKILRSALLSPKARRRLEYEIQALASLRHPGIAHVFEAGIHADDDGLLHRERPWFAMEYVEDAATLLAYADRENLSRNARIKLFLEVCDAVQHGHQRGVVHRDLKPDNILVDGAGRPKVIDFGVAKSTDADAPLTTIGSGMPEIVGTLPYLSPERVTSGRNAADVRTDVYALGVVLFQLLTGRFPLEVDPRDIVTSARRICREPPLKPSQVDAELPKDLDAIVLMALAKDPEQRYGSVDAFASDLGRFLDAMPIKARPPRLAYHLKLFARRNKVLVAASLAVVAVLIAGTLVSVGFALESHESEREAVSQRRRAEGVVETMLQRNIENTLRFAPAINQLAGGAKHVERLMASIATDLGELERLSEDDPRVRVLLAQTYVRLGDTQGNSVHANLGKPDAARASYERALEIAQSIPAHRVATLTAIDARLSLGELALQEGQRRRRRGATSEPLREEQRRHLTAALEEAEALHATFPTDGAVVRTFATAHNRLGSVELQAGNLDEVGRHADAILTLDPDDEFRVRRLAYDLRSWMYQRQGDWKAAVPSLQALAKYAERDAAGLRDTFRARQQLGRALASLGLAAGRAGDFDLAVPSYERMVEIERALLAEDPDRTERHETTFTIGLYDLGAVCVTAAQATEDSTSRRRLLGKALVAFREVAARFGPEQEASAHSHGLAGQVEAEIERLESVLASSDDE